MTLLPSKNFLVISTAIFVALGVAAFLLYSFKSEEDKTTDTPDQTVSFKKIPDSDEDGLLDLEEEKFYGTDVNNPDTDEDELSDREEVEAYYTNPIKKDTDDDNFTDSQEIANGYDPVGPGQLSKEQNEQLKKRLEDLNILFPDQYLLLENEIPIGYQLRNITPEQAQLYGATGNPGYYGLEDETSKNLTFGYLYVKSTAPDVELGVFVIKYYFDKEVSDAQLEEEWIKIYNTTPRILLRKGNTLVYIWSDTNDYANDMRLIADKLKQRLGLKEI